MSGTFYDAYKNLCYVRVTMLFPLYIVNSLLKKVILFKGYTGTPTLVLLNAALLLKGASQVDETFKKNLRRQNSPDNRFSEQTLRCKCWNQPLQCQSARLCCVAENSCETSSVTRTTNSHFLATRTDQETVKCYEKP